MSDNGSDKPENGTPKTPWDGNQSARKDVDQKQFEQLCALQCTLAEIAGVLGVSDDTVENRCKEWYGKTFSEVFKEKRAIGLVSLRRFQYKLSEKNAALAIHLGVNYLGQQNSLRVNVKHSGSIDLNQVDFTKLSMGQIERLRAGEDPELVLGNSKS